MAKLLSVTGVTVSGDSGVIASPVPVERGRKSRLVLNCTVLTGTAPTADVVVEGEVDGVLYPLHTFTQLTGAGQQDVLVELVPDRVKTTYTLGGTVTNFTAEVLVHQ